MGLSSAFNLGRLREDKKIIRRNLFSYTNFTLSRLHNLAYPLNHHLITVFPFSPSYLIIFHIAIILAYLLFCIY